MSDPARSPVVAGALVLLIAGRPGPAFRLDAAGENVLGRAGGSFVTLADRLASRHHAAIRFDAAAGAWMISDLGSRNGTWLDGVRIDSAALTPGCQLRIGTTELVFQPLAVERMPVDAAASARLVRRGPPDELAGAALATGVESRWPMLLYQAGIRLLAAATSREVVFTTLELAAEFTAASSFAWLEPASDGGPAPVCVVPPGSDLADRMIESGWSDALAGHAFWLAAAAPGEGDLACVPVVDGDRLRAVLVAGGSIRAADFDLLLALAGLAAAAFAARGRSLGPLPADAVSPGGTTEPFAAGDSDGEEPLVEGTLALSAADLELLRGGQPADWLTAAATLRLEDWERLLAIEALRRTGGGVPEAAALLGLSRATLYRRLDAYGLTRPGSRPAPP